MSVSKLEVVGVIALFQSEDFDIEIVGNSHNIKVKIADQGGYTKVKAEHILPHVIKIIEELNDD